MDAIEWMSMFMIEGCMDVVPDVDADVDDAKYETTFLEDAIVRMTDLLNAGSVSSSTPHSVLDRHIFMHVILPTISPLILKHAVMCMCSSAMAPLARRSSKRIWASRTATLSIHSFADPR